MTENHPTPKVGVLLPPDEKDGLRRYALDHLVTYGETSMAGFVYFSRLIDWQGKLRETVAVDMTPDYARGLTEGRLMLTQSVSCEYVSEIKFGESISLRVTVPMVRGFRMLGDFTFYRGSGAGEELVAHGTQLWVNADAHGTPSPWPADMITFSRLLGADVSGATAE
ncbi:acyl-CoA thioesterase [Streptomyces sp. NPDC004610]|uniref:acyl-CoA thioesterase n=1 Tax=unclassified Streptomyces TaxID=2593676 RepID=UPI0033AEA376